MDDKTNSDSPLEGSAVESVSLKKQRPQKHFPWLPIITCAVLITVAVGGWLAYQHFSSIPVGIEIAPANATISIEGKRTSLPDDGILMLRRAPVQMTITAPGYLPWNETVDPRALPDSRLSIALTPAPSFLSVSVSAPDATIRIDDGDPMPAPVTAMQLTAGDYSITATAEGFLSKTEQVTIAGGGARKSVEITLTRSTATLAIETVPAGATLSVAGHKLGTTPIELELDPGRYNFTVSLEGFKDWTFSVSAEAGDDIQLPAHTLERPDGTLELTSNPAGANITIDGKMVGKTPAQLSLRPGTHTIRVAREGFSEASLTTSIRSGQTNSAEINLEPILGTLTIQSQPSGAAVSSGGRDLGNTPLTIDLPATEHEFTLRRPGFLEDTFIQTVREGLALSVSRDLIRDRQLAPITDEERRALKAEDLPKKIETATGYPMRLVMPGSFMMGAARDDPHRSPDETQREVTITYPFYVGEHEVSNSEFRSFDEAFSAGSHRGFRLDADDRPVVNVSWDQAARFCNWLSELEGLPAAYTTQPDGTMKAVRPLNDGYRLPTEAEWEYIATLAAGEKAARFPWGSSSWPETKTVNLGGAESHRFVNAPAQDYEDLHTMTAPIRSYPADALGLHDLGGNVAEWCNDWYFPAPQRSPQTDPIGPERGTHYVIKGPSWMSNEVRDLRIARRRFANKPAPDVGFRVVRSVDKVAEKP